MSKIIDLDVNLTFKSDTHGDVTITYIQYTLDGQKDYDTGDSRDGVTLLNKQVLLNDVRVDMNPSSIKGWEERNPYSMKVWLDLMNQVDDFIFDYIFGLISMKNKDMILNLTQHYATVEQVNAGVIEPEDKDMVVRCITFTTIPSREDMISRALDLVSIAKNMQSTKL